MILNLRFCDFFEEVVSSPAATHIVVILVPAGLSMLRSNMTSNMKTISGVKAYLLHQRPNCLIQFLLCWRISTQQQQRSHGAGDFCLAWMTLGGGRLRYTGGAQLASGSEPSGTWVGISVLVLFLPENAMAPRTLFDKKQPSGLQWPRELFGLHWTKMTKRGPCFRFHQRNVHERKNHRASVVPSGPRTR
jgi:hypothetical protein